jgi:hypothetical protein
VSVCVFLAFVAIVYRSWTFLRMVRLSLSGSGIEALMSYLLLPCSPFPLDRFSRRSPVSVSTISPRFWFAVSSSARCAHPGSAFVPRNFKRKIQSRAFLLSSCGSTAAHLDTTQQLVIAHRVRLHIPQIALFVRSSASRLPRALRLRRVFQCMSSSSSHRVRDMAIFASQ